MRLHAGAFQDSHAYIIVNVLNPDQNHCVSRGRHVKINSNNQDMSSSKQQPKRIQRSKYPLSGDSVICYTNYLNRWLKLMCRIFTYYTYQITLIRFVLVSCSFFVCRFTSSALIQPLDGTKVKRKIKTTLILKGHHFKPQFLFKTYSVYLHSVITSLYRSFHC